jgi:hypothetical protein
MTDLHRDPITPELRADPYDFYAHRCRASDL